MKRSPKPLSELVNLRLLRCEVRGGSPRKGQDQGQLGVMIEPAIDTGHWSSGHPVSDACRGQHSPVRSPAQASASGLTRSFRSELRTRLHRPRKTCETRRSFTAESPQVAPWRGPAPQNVRESLSARALTEVAPQDPNLAPAQLAPHLSNLRSAVRACLRPTFALQGAGRAAHGSRRARAPTSSGPLCCVGDVCSSPHGSTPFSLRFPCSLPADLNLEGDQLSGSPISLAKRSRWTRDHRHGTVISPTFPDVGTCELRFSGRILVSHPSLK